MKKVHKKRKKVAFIFGAGCCNIYFRLLGRKFVSSLLKKLEECGKMIRQNSVKWLIAASSAILMLVLGITGVRIYTRMENHKMTADTKSEERTAGVREKPVGTVPNEVDEALNELDRLFRDYFTWLAGQYDPGTGGFYYARSSFTRPEFKPDIESTAQAINIMKRFGLVEKLPGIEKEKLIKFFQSRQEPGSGYFYDPHNNMKDMDRMLGRALSYSTDALKILGAKPLYSLPAGSTSSSSLPDYLKTPDVYKAWIEGLNWNDPWTAADAVSTTRVYFQNMTEEQRKPFLEQVWNFAEKTQDPQTGLWGGGSYYNRVSGAFKFALFYKAFKRPMPLPEKIYASILQCMREERTVNMMFVRNPLDALVVIMPQVDVQVQRDLPEIIKISTQNIKRFLKPDGGFSFLEEHSSPNPNKVVLGLGLQEGDMNAATGASSIREAVYTLSQKKVKPLTEYIKDFSEKMLNGK